MNTKSANTGKSSFSGLKLKSVLNVNLFALFLVFLLLSVSTVSALESQTITFGALSNKTYGDSNFSVNATANSTLLVNFTTASSACTVNSDGTVVHIESIGDCTINASQAGNDTYGPALDVLQSFTINKKTLTVTGITASNRVYNGTPEADIDTLGANLVGVVGSENVTLDNTSATGSFNNKNFGTGKTVTISGLALAGADIGNYNLTQPTITANITTRPITVTAVTTTRAYDGTNSSAGTPTITSGTLATGDSVTWSQTFSNKNVGTGKSLIPSGTVTDGNSGNNYAVTFVPDTTGVITSVQLTVSAPSLITTKEYDGSTTAAVTAGTLSNNVTGDNVTVSAVATYDNASVGTSKTITVVYTLGGADSTNYIKPVNGTDATGIISLKSVTVTADVKSKVYGAVDPGFTYTNTSLVGSDVFSGELSRDAGTNIGNYAITKNNLTAGSNYNLTFVSADLTITAKPVTVTVDAKTKTYGDVDPALTYTNTSLVGPDTISGELSRGAGTNVGTYAINQNNLTVSSNYNLTFVGNNLTITVKPVTVTADAKTKIYGDVDPALTFTNTSLVGSEVFTGELSRSAGVNIGTYTINNSNLTAGSNYNLTFVSANFNITTRPITVTAVTTTKAYDGTNSSAGTPTITSGTLATGDNVTWTQTFDNKSVGTGKSLIPFGTVTDGNSGNNYAVTFVPDTTGVITSVQLTVSAPSLITTKEYDGSTTAAVTAGTLSNNVTGDNVTVSAVATYDNASAGINKTITVVYTLGGVDASNYIKPVNGTDVTGLISVKQLNVSAPSLTTTKPYDGSTTALVTAGSLIGNISGENVTVSAVATYDNASVGTSKTITIVYTLDGANASNYLKPVDGTNGTGAITAIQLNVSAPSLIITKPYDGSTTASVTAGSLIGNLSGENVTVSAVATYDNASVGTSKTITVVYTLGGADAVNYIKPVDGINGTGVITAVQLTVSTPLLNTTKLYDGFANATVTAGSLIGNLSGETVTVSAVATYDNASAGTNKTITVVYTLGGANASNYLKPVNGTDSTGVITPKPITVTAAAKIKVYGAVDPNLTYTNDSLLNSDVFTGSLSRVAGSDVGSYNITMGSLSAGGNYSLTFVGSNLTITPATLTITANNTSKTYGSAVSFTGTEFTTTGLVSGNTVTSVTLTSAGAINTSSFGSYTIVPSSEIGSGLGNYTIVYLNGTLTVNKANATISVTNYSVVYDGAPHFATGTATGLFGETLTAGLNLTGTNHTNASTYADTWTFTSPNANYSDTSGTVNNSITKAVANITVIPFTVTYNGISHVSVGSATGVSGVNLTGSLNITGTNHTNAGVYTDTWNFVGGTYYNDASGTVNNTIGKVALVVVADSKSKAFGTLDPALTYNITSGAFVGSENFTGGQIARVFGESPGTYAIWQNNLTAGGNYNITFVNGTLTIFDGVSPVINAVNISDPDFFYSSYGPNSIVHLWVNATDNHAINVSRSYANFSNISNCSSNGIVGLTYNSSSGLYYAICNVSVEAATSNFVGGSASVVVFDNSSNYNSSVYAPILLYNMTTPPGASAYVRFGSETTDMSKVLNFSAINMIVSIEINGTAVGAPWSDFKKVSMLNFTSLDLSTQAKAAKMSNLANAINVTIAPPNQFQQSRIYVDTSAFEELNTTTNITFYDLPFSSMPNVAADLSAATQSPLKWWLQGPFDAAYNSSKGNLTIQVGGFSGYNVTDTVNPKVTINNPINGTLAPAPFTVNATLNGTGTQISNATFLLNGVQIASYYFGGANSANCTGASGSEVMTCVFSYNGSSGAQTLTVIALDFGGSAPGNMNQSNVSFSVDTTIPTVVIVSPTSRTYTNTNITLNFTASDPSTGINACWYKVDSGSIVPLASCANTTFIALDGAHNLTVYANDSANNIGSALVSFAVDTVAPAIAITSPTNQNYTSNVLNLSFTVNETTSSVGTCQYSVNGASNTSVSSCANGLNTVVMALLADGPHTVTLFVNDSAGNMNTSSVSFNISTTIVVGNNTTNVTASNNQSQIVVTNSTPNVTIIVPAGVSNVSLNLTQVFNNTTATATLTSSVNVTANTTLGTVTMSLPPNVTITGATNWTGTISLPSVVIVPASQVTASSGMSVSSVDGSVAIGSTQGLTLSNAARILIPGLSGHYAGYIDSAGTFHAITTTCNADVQATVDAQLGAGAECKIDVGSDLVIWTKHFTTFMGYSQTTTGGGGSTPTPSSAGGGMGGAGSFTSTGGSATSSVSFDGMDIPYTGSVSVSPMNVTTVSFSLKNNQSVAMKDFEVKIRIPDTFTTNKDDLNFNLAPDRFESGSIIAVWKFSVLNPGENLVLFFSAQKPTLLMSKDFTLSLVKVAPTGGSTGTPITPGTLVQGSLEGSQTATEGDKVTVTFKPTTGTAQGIVISVTAPNRKVTDYTTDASGAIYLSNTIEGRYTFMIKDGILSKAYDLTVMAKSLPPILPPVKPTTPSSPAKPTTPVTPSNNQTGLMLGIGGVGILAIGLVVLAFVGVVLYFVFGKKKKRGL